MFLEQQIKQNQHIRMISEGSCDTEDWSNDEENSALTNRKKLHLKNIFKYRIFISIVIILYFTILLHIFDQVNEAFQMYFIYLSIFQKK